MTKNTKDKNVEINAQKLDEDVRKAAGGFYNRTDISNFVMNKAKNYYNMMMNRGRISEVALKKLCSKYKLKAKDYIIVRPKLEVVKVNHVPVPTELPVAEETAEVVKAPEESPKVEVNVDLAPVTEKVDELILQVEILLEALTKITEVVGTCFAESKSTNFLVQQLTDKVAQNYKMQKEVLDKLEQNTRYKKNNGNNGNNGNNRRIG